ncbi:MAG: cupin domain-containing protein [Kiloniellales bacterium]
MTAVTPDASNHHGLEPLNSRFVNVDQLPWRQTQFPGVEVKILIEDKETGLTTTMLRMAPGASLPDHEHVRIEQTYVLEGRLVDDEGECTAGNYVWRPAGSRHIAHTPDGALLLAFFLKPNRFYDKSGAGFEIDPEPAETGA